MPAGAAGSGPGGGFCRPAFFAEMVIFISNKRAGGQGHYVGRPTPLGNPYRMQDEAERDQVIAQYRRWLRKRLLKDDRVRAEMNRLYRELVQTGQLELTCWCSPRRCHAEVIAEALAQAARARGHRVEVRYG